MSGRPLRFLGGTVAGWVAIRTVMLWPTLDTPAAIPRLLIPAAQAAPGAKAMASTMPMFGLAAAAVAKATIPQAGARALRRPATITATSSVWPTAGPIAIRVAPTARERDAGPIAPFAAPVPSRLPPPRRWSGSTWLMLRDGRSLGAGLGASQLGGAQAGARLAYAIDRARRVAIVARITSPLRGRGREASLGVEWRPTALPIRLVAERRLAIDGGRGGPAAGVIAGTGPAPLALGFDLETYGQAGVIRRDRTEAFAEGAARISRAAFRWGRARLDIGIGAWGAAQRDAQRLDLGPTVGVAVPVGDRTVRAFVDWRQRVAGHARPGSGPTLTIGADF